MPALKQLTCHVEGPGNIALPEYETEYRDGLVESWIIPTPPEVPFTIHLSSKGYIAPGLAMFVYMDGVYQCNRNRTGLVYSSKSLHDKEIDFRVRQKEEKDKPEWYTARDWFFAELDTCEFSYPAHNSPPLTILSCHQKKQRNQRARHRKSRHHRNRRLTLYRTRQPVTSVSCLRRHHIRTLSWWP